ncbi:hypothetical protein NE619_09565 [Anaerovorax odorimutans]|uniref:Trigger factor n=1 Tax=Anaerovorax odorimutans TaxID=109327 RepID=A0ABT1RP55_9FIRM|nr:hypothetical protein [Anaerovorax odorimutans]MCQ4636978.1 hypothetical protein [Anaerovorax odorimutans]
MDKMKDEKSGGSKAAKKTGNKKLLIAVIGLAAVLIIVGIVAAATGVFSGGGKSGSGKVDKSSLLESSEYKAAAEYNTYLDGLSDEEMEKVVDTSEDAIYDVPAKVKEICEKYGLKYAAKSTVLSSYDQVEKELEARKLSGVLGADLSKTLQETMKEYDGGYALDDGNLNLEIEEENSDANNVFIYLNISPEGAFPYLSPSFSAPDKDEEPQSVEEAVKDFTFQPQKGAEFACRTEGSDGTAFGKAGDYYITMAITREQSDAKSDEYEKALAKADEKVKKEAGLDSLDELEEKVYSGLETAWEKEPEAMQEALDSGDQQQYQALQKKYSEASKKEIALFEGCKKELESYEKEVAVTEKDVKEYLDKIDFSKFL